MQREIKFRAWNKLEKRMESVNFIKFFQNAYTMASTRYRDKKSKKLYDDQFAYGQEDGSDNVILMQYIGLKDKNGKEIYEEDVLSDGVQLWLVRYSKTMSGHTATEIVNKRLDFGSCFSLYHLVTGHNCKREVEVIGNIYDNPELLEVSE